MRRSVPAFGLTLILLALVVPPATAGIHDFEIRRSEAFIRDAQTSLAEAQQALAKSSAKLATAEAKLTTARLERRAAASRLDRVSEKVVQAERPFAKPAEHALTKLEIAEERLDTETQGYESRVGALTATTLILLSAVLGLGLIAILRQINRNRRGTQQETVAAGLFGACLFAVLASAAPLVFAKSIESSWFLVAIGVAIGVAILIASFWFGWSKSSRVPDEGNQANRLIKTLMLVSAALLAFPCFVIAAENPPSLSGLTNDELALAHAERSGQPFTAAVARARARYASADNALDQANSRFTAREQRRDSLFNLRDRYAARTAKVSKRIDQLTAKVDRLEDDNRRFERRFDAPDFGDYPDLTGDYGLDTPTTEDFGSGNGSVGYCSDGTLTDSIGQPGACSHHGGVR